MDEINTNTRRDYKKVIVPVPPRYIVEKIKLGFGGFGYEVSWSQALLLFAGAVIITIFMGFGDSWIYWVIDAIIISTMVAIFYSFAKTHEKMLESKILFKHRIRKLRKLNNYSNIASPTKQISKLYPYQNKTVLPNGVIDYGNNRYGVILNCQTKQLVDDDLIKNVAQVGRFFNSLPTLIKIRASSKIPYLNPVEKMTKVQINETKDPNKKALLYSLHNLSSNAMKSPVWNVRIFIVMQASPKEIETFAQTILPGIRDRLAAANTLATVVTRPDEIYNILASDYTSYEVTNNKTPALYGNKAIWNERIRQLMQGSIIDKGDHLLVNHKEFVTCIMAGIPVGEVSGFPPTLSPEILTQLYRLSASEEHSIRIDISIYPIPSNIALNEIKRAINRLLMTEKSVEGKPVSKYSLGLDVDDLKILFADVKDGKQRIFDLNYIITIFAKSYESLIAGKSKVAAILNANNIQNKVPENRILETIQATQFMPFYDNETSIWLPTNGLEQITPLANGPTNVSSETGTYFGNEIPTNQEVILDLDKIAGGHTLMIGPTRSGKTTAMSLTGIRTILRNEAAVYITNKPDATTNYLAVAEYFKDISQIIHLGRLPDGSIKYNINPLEILYNENVQFDPVTKFYEHVDFVKFFISLITSGGQIAERRTDKQLGYIESTILQLYAKYGIDPEDPATWKKEKQPTLMELHEKIWAKDFNADPKNTTIEAVYSRTTKFKTTLSWLSNPTNVSLTKQYTVIDLSAVPEAYQETMNYMLTNILALRFNMKSKMKTTIMIDEAGVFLKNQHLQDKFSLYLKQAASYGVRVIVGSQQLADLVSIGPELQANISISEIYGLNIGKSIDMVVKFFKLSDSDEQFLLSCAKPGQCVLSVGYPYATNYHIQRIPSELEAQILFGKQERPTAYSFIHPALEAFAKEQGVIMSDWINGDTTILRTERSTHWIQRAIGTGKAYAYIDPSILDSENSEIVRVNGSNQSHEHFLSVVQIAAYFIERDIPTTVNHNDDADVVIQLLDGPAAFEYQTAGNNDPKRMMAKRETGESKHGRLFFVGNSQSVKEVSRAIGTDEIVIPRGTQLETLVQNLLGEKQNSLGEN